MLLEIELNTFKRYYLLMLNREQIIEKLADRNLSEVARRTNLTQPTVWRVVNEPLTDVGYEAIRTLSDYLEAQA